MAALELIIGNKNYSSWSFRPWLAMTVAGIAFNEIVSPFDEAHHNAHFLQFSPAKKVPVLRDGDLTLWESLAILEYLAERFPDKGLWPPDAIERAKARVVAHEMHAGFAALRAECPMNMRRPPSKLEITPAAWQDVTRIVEIWRECLEASGGPFLFGGFSNADAMFAPVVNRLAVYQLAEETVVAQYTEAMTTLPAWQAWAAAAAAEPWVVDEEEV